MNFRTLSGLNIPLPAFFPDATRGVVKCLDARDLEESGVDGILVNTYHLYRDLGMDFIKKRGGIASFMDWQGAVISDSGGFQVGSLVKRNPNLGKVTDSGVSFLQDGKKTVLTPENSIDFQMKSGSDMVVVLDDFTPPDAGYDEAKISVERTIAWAKRSKEEYQKIIEKEKLPKDKRPYILGVVQGGRFQDLRKYCTKSLLEIGFDGLGFGGWPMDENNKFDIKSAVTIAENSPKDIFLYGLGIGKPDDIVSLCKLGFNIFDCVLPTRDARHGRLYVFTADSVDKIDLSKKDFYETIAIDKRIYRNNESPIGLACDCLTCNRYSKAYLSHLFAVGDFTAGRLATIHNLRFYTLLMEKIREEL